MDERAHNRAAWDLLSRTGDRWTIPVDVKTIASARQGKWSVVLTNTKPVPREWFQVGDPIRKKGLMLDGVDILALASGGGQQGPIFAAAGARVTVFDNSPEQLAKDRSVATREGLEMRLVEGTMEDLSAFPDASFDLVFNPTSVMFTRDVRKVWREAARVLRPGGVLMTGFLNPACYLFGRDDGEDVPTLTVKHSLPYADESDLGKEELGGRVGRREPLEFSHTLADLLGGQTEAGLAIVAVYEDIFGDVALDGYMPGMMATRAIKM
jgi:SAM-dependent methyltransferase